MNAKLPHIGFCIGRNPLGHVPVPVRISASGNLVDAGTPDGPTGMCVFGRAAHTDQWPQVYPTENDAWQAIHANESKCDHRWAVHSHEERRCLVCKTVQFMAD